MPDDKQGRRGEGGEGGAGGRGGDPSGRGGQGGEGGRGGDTRGDTRTTRLTMWALGCAAVLALVVSGLGWVQAEANRDTQADTLVTLRAIEAQQAIITANAELVAEDAADVAAFVAELRARPPAASSAVAYQTIARIGLAVERLTGEPLPDLPPDTTTTTTTGG